MLTNHQLISSYQKLNYLLLKGVSETVQNEVKEQKGGFLSMLLGTLGASLLRNILAGTGVNRAGKGVIATRQGRGIVRAGYGCRSSKNKKWIFNTASSFDKFLIYKNIIKMNLDLMVFILEIICTK